MQSKNFVVTQLQVCLYLKLQRAGSRTLVEFFIKHLFDNK